MRSEQVFDHVTGRTNVLGQRRSFQSIQLSCESTLSVKSQGIPGPQFGLAEDESCTDRKLLRCLSMLILSATQSDACSLRIQRVPPQKTPPEFPQKFANVSFILQNSISLQLCQSGFEAIKHGRSWFPLPSSGSR